jgi:beta-xylosidase
MRQVVLLLIVIVISYNASAQKLAATGQQKAFDDSVWSPEISSTEYRNPILYSDYPDPDVVRVGSDFYLVSSSFESVPGLPILHSRDLLHWELIGHALKEQSPIDRYRVPQHGKGVWAPSLRFHAGEFFLYYPDPDFGIYLVKAKSITGPWSDPILVKAAPGWIDPCPLWDDDGNAYLVNALAGSRAGAKSVVVLSKMSKDGTRLLDGGSIIVDGHESDPTLEGPKIYKRKGYYYLFAPAGGVTQGYQVIYRSRAITGPYERRVVLHQGSTPINGPHQGAWVDTPQGENWFLHFQDRGPYGRVLDLEPMTWTLDGWPAIGIHQDNLGNGEPVLTFRKPRIANAGLSYVPAMSDEFNSSALGLQWQWQANPGPTWAFPAPALGALRMICIPSYESNPDLRSIPNVLLQKFPGPEFEVTTKLRFQALNDRERTGIVVLGRSYSTIYLERYGNDIWLRQENHSANLGDTPSVVSALPVVLPRGDIFLRVTVERGAALHFSYSIDGEHFQDIGLPFPATAGTWIGAKIGLYALAANGTGKSSIGEVGFADYDWFHVAPLTRNFH